MRHAAIFTIVLTLSSLGAQSSFAQIAWESKLRDAHTKAKQQGKLMLLHFYTDNCVYCDRLEAGAYRSASVAKTINENFVPVKVHGTKNPKLAAMFKVSKYPTDVIVTTDGKALSHSVSPQQPDRYIGMLSSTQLNYAKSKTMLARAKQPAKQTVAATAPVANNQAATTPPPSFVLPGESDSVEVASKQQNNTPQSNQFMMPDAELPETTAATPSNDGVQASLASSRSGGMTLSADTTVPTPDDANSKTESAPSGSAKAELAMQGFCPVSVVNAGEWVEGKPTHGVIHLGKLYLFANQQAMDLFLADPTPFTPMLNAIDVVQYFDNKKIVAGKREWGVIDPIHNRMFFFADEETMVQFEKNFDRYLDASIEVMDQAIQDSNPGV